jgi:hypothetical protein
MLSQKHDARKFTGKTTKIKVNTKIDQKYKEHSKVKIYVIIVKKPNFPRFHENFKKV